MHMGRVVFDLPFLEPSFDAAAKIVIVEAFAPEGAVFYARFGQRTVEIEQANETWPRAAPIRNGEYRSVM